MRFETNFPKEFWDQFERLEKIDDVAPKMLESAAPIAVDAIKKRLRPHNQTYQLINSVKASKAKKAKTGGYVKKINFVGYDKHRDPTPSQPRGVANAVKAAGIEYGNANEPARPFLQSAANDCAAEVAAAMQQKFEVEMAINGTK